MTLQDLEKIFFEKHLKISIDTRTLQPGDVFFALRGENFDGNEFVDEALQKGASFVVTENQNAPMDKSILVSGGLAALREFARDYRRTLDIPILAIGGSNGKTTTKELTRRVLERKYKVSASPASFNNHIGVPLTLLSIKPEHQIAVIEIGDNHEGEVTELLEIVRPTHGLLTNIGKDHIGFAGGFEANVRAKLELYKYFSHVKMDGRDTVFVNADDEKLFAYSSELEKGSNTEIVKYVPGEVISGEDLLVTKIEGEEIKTNLVGEYNLANLRAAWTVGKYFGVPPEEIKAALESFVPENNRSQKVVTEKNIIVLDAYNANPDSMKLALLNFAKMKSPFERRVAILGDMFELGEFAAAEHRSVMELARETSFENYFVGQEFFALKDGAAETRDMSRVSAAERGSAPENFFETTDELIKYLKENKIENAFVLIKGSRGMALEKILKEGLL